MTDFADLGLRFVPVNDAAANKALNDVEANSVRAEAATKKLTATQQSAANAQRLVVEASRMEASALGQVAAAVAQADAAQRASLRSTQALATEIKKAAAQAQSASVSFNHFYDAAERDFATQYVRSMGSVSAAHGAGVKSSKAMTQATLNLSRQFADVGVTAAMGMSPLMILIQQGPQIADAFQMAKSQGIGFSDIMGNLKGVLGPILPLLAGVAGAVAIAAGGFALFEREIDKNTKYATTWGDTWNATVHVVGEAIMNGPIGTGLRWLGKFFGTVLDAIVDGVMWWADKTVGHFGAAYQLIVKNWRQLPAVFGVIMQGAANISIQAVEGMINKSIDGINVVLKAANKAPLSYINLPEIKLANAALAKEYTATADKIASSFKAGREGLAGRIAAQADREFLARQKATKGANDHADAAKRDTDAVDALTESLMAFNKAAEERNRIAEQFAGFQVQTVADPIDTADAANKMAGAADLNRYADLLDQAAAHTRQAAQGMADAFGGVGAAIGNVASILADYDAKQSDIAARRANELAIYKTALADKDKTEASVAQAGLRWTHAQTMAERESANARLSQYGDILGAAKGFFDEQSTGYKVLQRAETAFRILQFAMSVRAMAVKTAEAGVTVAAHGAMTASGIAAGAANIFAQLGPWAFPVVGAMIAVMAGLGAKAGGSASAPGATDMKTRQESQGTGSVLGDASAKSESLSKALAHADAYQNKDLEYANSMVKSLRSIDDQIGAVAAALSRTLSAGGSLSTDGLGLGTATVGPGLLQKIINPLSALLPGLFGTKTTKTLQDQGLQFNAQTVGAIGQGGINGSTYQQVLTETQKKFLGVTYSDKTKSSTSTAALDADLAKQITQLIGSLKAGVLSAAGVLGVTGAEAVLDAFTVNLGKLSFKDMSGAEIQEALNAIFSKLGDDLAATALPAIEQLQKVGEGAFETLVRVARQYEVVNVTLSSIGKTFGDVGVASLAARERLVDLFGGLDAFTEQTSFFAENFLSDAQRLAPVQAAVTAELKRLGLAGIQTKEQFSALVMGLDVSTQAGAEMYAALLGLAPAFLKVSDAATEAVQAANDNVANARSALTEAYDREASAIQNTRDKFLGFADSLRRFREQLGTGAAAGLSPQAQYLATKAAFDKTRGLAAGGDEQALSDLQSVSQAYLDASKSYYASSAGYFQDLEAVRAAVTASEVYARIQVGAADQQLAALNAQVAGQMQTTVAVLSVRDAILALTVALTQQAGAVGAAGGFNGASYLKTNSDVAAAYGQYQAGQGPWEAAMGSGLTAEAFARKHYDMAGKAEGRAPFATGGSFMVGGTGGPDSKAVNLALTPGELVNIRRPGDVSNDDGILLEIRDVLGDVRNELKRANNQRGAVGTETLGRLDRVADGLERVQRATRDAA